MTMTQPNVVGPSAAAMIQPNAIAPSNAPATEKEACGTEAGSDAAVAEGAPDEKGSPAPTTPPSWEKMMEMLKRVSCFTNAETPSSKMLDLFPLTKRISVNMSGDPPTFVLARLPFGTLEFVVSCIQHLQEWTVPETAEVVIHFVLSFFFF